MVKITANNKYLAMQGFTLVEMAMVLIITGFILGGLLVSFTAQIEIRNHNETKQKIAAIKEAIVGYTIAYGRLPCPADPTVSSGTVGVGTQKFNVAGTACNSTAGVVPWVDLGVLETDAWGRRFTYSVSNSFSDVIVLNTVAPPVSCLSVPTNSSFALCSEGDITVTDGVVAIAIKVPAIVVSHGKNGFGAYMPDGSKISDTAASVQEKENSDSDADFTSMTENSAYDDIVDWISPNILFNRMVTAGRLP